MVTEGTKIHDDTEEIIGKLVKKDRKYFLTFLALAQATYNYEYATKRVKTPGFIMFITTFGLWYIGLFTVIYHIVIYFIQ